TVETGSAPCSAAAFVRSTIALIRGNRPSAAAERMYSLQGLLRPDGRNPPWRSSARTDSTSAAVGAGNGDSSSAVSRSSQGGTATSLSGWSHRTRRTARSRSGCGATSRFTAAPKEGWSARNPVLCERPGGCMLTLRKILVPIDDSPLAGKVLDHALTLAE